MPTFRFDVQQKTGKRERFPLNGSNGIARAPHIVARTGASAVAELHRQTSNWSAPDWQIVPVLIDGCQTCNAATAAGCPAAGWNDCGKRRWRAVGHVHGGRSPIGDTNMQIVAHDETVARQIALDIMRGWPEWQKGAACEVTSVTEVKDFAPFVGGAWPCDCPTRVESTQEDP